MPQEEPREVWDPKAMPVPPVKRPEEQKEEWKPVSTETYKVRFNLTGETPEWKARSRYGEITKLAYSAMLSTAMARRGITKEDLSSQVGVSMARINQLLTGQHNARIGELGGILGAMGVELHFWITPDEARRAK